MLRKAYHENRYHVVGMGADPHDCKSALTQGSHG